VLGPDGARLAKRHGAVTLEDLAALGRGPQDAVAWMAQSLGLSRPGDRISASDLAGRFEPARLHRGPTVLARLPPCGGSG